MTKDDEREVQRKLRKLQHAEKIGRVAKTCRYGLSHFVPFLRHIILHDTGPEAFEFIGGRAE